MRYYFRVLGMDWNEGHLAKNNWIAREPLLKNIEITIDFKRIFAFKEGTDRKVIRDTIVEETLRQERRKKLDAIG
jgi:hypothetical protein